MNLYSIPPLLTLCGFAGLAVLTIFRGRWTKSNILFLIICILGTFLYIDILCVFNVTSANTALAISRIDHFFIVYLLPVYLHFFHAYLNISRRKWLIPAAYAYAFVLMCLTPTSLYIASMQKHYFGYFAKGGMLFPLFGLAALFVSIYVLILIFQSIGREKNNTRKNRLKYMFVGFGIMGFMNGLDVFPLHGVAMYPPGNFSFFPLIIFAYGIFKYDLLDTGVLIKKGLVYSLLTACLTCTYASIIIAAQKLFKASKVSDSIFFPILFFLLIAFVFGPLKSKIQTIVDRLFYKGKYDYQQTIKHVSQMIVSLLDLDEINKLLMETVSDALKVEHCALFLPDASKARFIKLSTRGNERLAGNADSISKESQLVICMQIHQRPVLRKDLNPKTASGETGSLLSEMNVLCAEIALPLMFRDTLKGFVILGEKLSGDLFTPEDLDLLETLSGQSTLAMENAQSYKKVHDLSRDLEKKVKERTRDLQAVLFEKERTQEQLIRSESLAAIGQLVAGVAHELNNPLASVTSLIQATIEDLTQWDKNNLPDEDLIDDLKFADKELGRAKSIVLSLLGLSRQTQTYSEAVNMNTVVKDALRVLFNQYKRHDLDIVENYDPDLPDIHGNFANLGQVALNIIQNAFQAAGEKKSNIFLETHFDKVARQVVFACQDTGPGIPEPIRQDIFKPFFTTKGVGKGTGLGLYLCHEIIRKHGGSLTLENTAGKGAKFVVRLPIDGEGVPERDIQHVS
ncbi:MAG: ATP-binding protein [Pseudomonadota bacterium]|uniref:histidine kinase n=1 Tax=Candidatus Desulfatibia profunda TaxID=2841695 RepID=A0A8J6NT12_9BACT|nr:GAF domain-containing protein [Candidatus Desulfatibia profunda]MBL7179578.1 GAF domain-containing protein [Desulfobacterales bacterium]